MIIILNILFVSSIVIILSIISNKFSQKIGIPSLLLFIGLGLFFGSDGIVQIQFDNYHLAEAISSTALIFIMFYGGFGTRWKTAKPVAIKSLLLSSIGVLLTALLVGFFCYFVLHIELLESFLIGAVISSTDAASVFSILKSKKLALKNQTSPMLELESGSNDPTAYMLTIIILDIMNGSTAYGKYIYVVPGQFLIGGLCALVLSYVTIKLYKNFNLRFNGLEIIYFVGMVLLSFSLPEKIGGNGYLSTYIFGIIIGNHSFKNKRVLINFFDGLTGLVQICIFFLLGLLAFPSQMPQIMFVAFFITLFLTFIARPLAIFTILKPLKCNLNQIALVSFAGIRGASSIVFAIIATVNPAYLKNDIFHIVFSIVLFSIAFQGTLLPYVAKKLKMIDEDGDVLKTFTDYQEENAIQLIRLPISHSHPWISLRIKELELPPQMLVVTIIKMNTAIIPNGNTPIEYGDIVLIAAPGYQDSINVEVNEITINNDHDWKQKQVHSIKIDSNSLIAIIKRGNDIIVPNGNTVINEDDKLVLINKFD
ncbi:potassium/proton antiporter [Clostridiisalibacter paucivorans]|uniref:potassium/proton antiporter n=1 Tax=Clostridiisalibacter paucivorans TaxID=408753 RepID=UPI000A4029F3|nr:potassium/proton antiporter [Clostridiisalibacter paucivorans]